ncbi:hypothetical protein CWM52_16585 [Raoultella sp. T31]|nr:hypothetical protein CWM52_16585 [Raoultella sp. T31]
MLIIEGGENSAGLLLHEEDYDISHAAEGVGGLNRSLAVADCPAPPFAITSRLRLIWRKSSRVARRRVGKEQKTAEPGLRQTGLTARF